MNTGSKLAATVAAAAAVTFGTLQVTDSGSSSVAIDAANIATQSAQVELWKPELVDLGIVDISSGVVDVSGVDLEAGSIKHYTAPLNVVATDTVAVYEPTLLKTSEGDVLDISTVPISEGIVNITKNAEVVRKVSNMFMDKRNFVADSRMLEEDKVLEQWYNIYHQEREPIKFVPIPDGVRMVAEARLPESEVQRTVLNENLAHYKSLGYNAILVAFDTTEDVILLRAFIEQIRRAGFNVWFTFAGATSKVDGVTYLHDTSSVFPDPAVLKSYLVSLAPLCDGFIGMWKRTSAHFFIQDQPYMDYVASCVREGNPNIPVLGEIYFGPTADVPEGDGIKKLASGSVNHNYLVPRKAENASGYLVVNLGYSNVNVKGVLAGLLNGQANDQKLVLITGPNPVFLSTKQPNLTYSQLRQVYNALEQRWLGAGAKGTVLLHGEMSDGNAVEKISNNISVSKYFE